MLIVEYRITMPMSVEEYQIGQLYCVAEMSRENSNGDEGIEVIKNEPFENTEIASNKLSSGQYTDKIYHLKSKFPGFLRMLLSDRMMSIHEEAWNAFPYCKTILTHSVYESFCVTVETMHLPDRGETENAHGLNPSILNQRKVVHLDITAESGNEYGTSKDPKKFHSEKTGRGPLLENWQNTVAPVMTCYKLVTVKCPTAFQSRLESWVQEHEEKLFLQFHKKLFCSIDDWHGKTMADIREIEDKVKKDLAELLAKKH